jgi:translation initiation factor 2B subunit (eIF-2B alpha/beta/delta family)
MVTDDTAPFFIDNTIENDVDVKKVFLWSDCIKPDWTTINKVWSFSIWLSSWHSGIPLYIVWSLLKIDIDQNIWIEERHWKELWPEAPDGLNIINYAFDMVPPKCITWIVTEFWVFRPENLMKEVKKYYPRMLE